MNVSGTKVRVRDRIPVDFITESAWSLDEELKTLNPPDPGIFNNQQFSIETLDGRHIGSCSLYNQTIHDVQLGILIGDKNCWDKGYGTEVVSILVHHWLYVMKTPRIWLKVLPDNLRAIRCYEKCGFEQCGTLRYIGYTFVIMERKRNGTPNRPL